MGHLINIITATNAKWQGKVKNNISFQNLVWIVYVGKIMTFCDWFTHKSGNFILFMGVKNFYVCRAQPVRC